MNGSCVVVFPTRDRLASGAVAGDKVEITLELDAGYRNVDMPLSLADALHVNDLNELLNNLTYSKRKEYARQVEEAKTDKTREARIQKVVADMQSHTQPG